jgi:hypothetical protein
VVPQVGCVLQHWYELRPKGENVGVENNKRFTALTALARRARRHGTDTLRGDVLAALRGERAMELAFLPVASGLFQDDELTHALELAVMRQLRGGSDAMRVAATFAGAFRLDSWEEVALVLSERVVLAVEDKLLVQAAREVLEIRLDTKDGGKCRRCGLTGSLPSTQKLLDWVPRRAS